MTKTKINVSSLCGLPKSKSTYVRSARRASMLTDVQEWSDYLENEGEICTLKHRLCELEKSTVSKFEQLKDMASHELSDYLKHKSERVDVEVGKFVFFMKWLREDWASRSLYVSELIEHINLTRIFETSRHVLDQEFEDGGLLSDNVNCLKIYMKLLRGRSISQSDCEVNINASPTVSQQPTVQVQSPRVSLTTKNRTTPSRKRTPAATKTRSRPETPRQGTRRSARLSPAPAASVNAASPSSPGSSSCSSSSSSSCSPSPPGSPKSGSGTRGRRIGKNLQTSPPKTPTKTAAAGISDICMAKRSVPGRPRFFGATNNYNRKPTKRHKLVLAINPNENSEKGKRQRLNEQSEPTISENRTTRGSNATDASSTAADGNGEYLFYAHQERRGRFLYRFDWQTKQSTQLYKFETPRMYSATIGIGNELYDLGGSEAKFKPTFGDSSQGSKFVEIFGIGEERFRRHGPPLKERRKEFPVCSSDGYLYVLGGCFGDSATNCCERLYVADGDSLEDWENIPYLISPRGAHTAAAVNSRLYAIGGIGRETFSTVESYDVAGNTNKWTNVAPLSIRRGRHASAVLNDVIYVLGGENADEVAVNSCELYYPGVDKWTALPPMRHERIDFNVSVVGGRILAIGGTSSVQPKEIEAYDPREGTWELLPWEKALHSAGSFYNAVGICIRSENL